MIDMDEKKEVVSHKWADRVAIALLVCLLMVLIVTGIHTCKAYSEENKCTLGGVLCYQNISHI